MFKNYLIITLRNLVRQKGYTAINLLGLATGIACAVLIFLYVQDELSYESFHANKDNIYRTSIVAEINGKVDRFAVTPPPMGPKLMSDYPEVVNFCRLQQTGEKTLLRYEDKKFYEKYVFIADSTFFSMFSYQLTQGDAKTALTKPNTVVITESVAKKLFGKENPIGKVILFSNTFQNTVTGIAKDPPKNSHIRFDALVSYTTLTSQYGEQIDGAWGGMQDYTYIQTTPGFNAKAFEKKMPKFYDTYMAPIFKQFNAKMDIYVMNIQDIHLHSDFQGELTPSGNVEYVYIFMAVAVFLLIIAAINYTNLATARATKRAKEVGIRKVMGAYKKGLIFQFLIEAVVLSFLALIIAIALVEISLPAFNSIAEKDLSFGIFKNPMLLLILVGIALLVGLIAGSYPAFYLSWFEPVKVLKGNYARGTGRFSLRKTLVVVQFTIAIAMIICTFVAASQLNFLKTKNLGFNKDQMMTIAIEDTTVSNQREVIRQELLKNPKIQAVSMAQAAPGGGIPLQIMRAESNNQLSDFVMNVLFVDYSFLKTMEISLKSGRDFSNEIESDNLQAGLMNEAAEKKIGGSAIGKRFQWGLKKDGGAVRDGRVVGVIKDIHFASLHNTVEPLLILPAKKLPAGYLMVRIAPQDIPQTVEYARGVWQKMFPNHVFDMSFLRASFDAQYRAEETVSTILRYFSILTVIIAALGLFGLASYTAQQRRKEIGIRKVLGASEAGILGLLSKEFATLVLISTLLAAPIAWYAMTKWLEDFAYRVEIDAMIFIWTGILALVVAMITVSYQTLKASISNPIHALRYE